MSEERKDLTITDDLKPVLEMLKPSDASAVVELREELADNWQKKQIFRTETEMRISVLNDAKHPTNASKYWQSVREQGAMVRQIGFTPKEFAQKIIENEGGLEKAQKLFNSKSDMSSEYKPTPIPKNSVGIKYSNILNKIFKDDYDFSDYARAASIYWPGNRIGHGREDIAKFWKLLKEALKNIKFSVEHLSLIHI